MKKLFLIFMLIALSSFLFAQKAGDKITFSSVDLNGNTVTDKLFTENKITMVNIWGTFCPPCIGEMPELGKWAREMPQDAQIIGLVCDVIGSDDKLLKYLEGVDAVPTTIFVDSDGNIIGEKVVGADVAKYKEQVKRLLTVKHNL